MVPPPSAGAFVCRWIESNLVHATGDWHGQPFRLTDEQRLFLWKAYELRPDGQRRYRTVLRGRPKGSGKTELAAAIGCVELGAAGYVDPASGYRFAAAPDIPVAASSFEQADLLFAAAKSMIAEGPLAPLFEVYDVEILPKGKPGRMYRVAAVAGSNDGARPSFLLADELHEWTGSKERVHLVLSNGLEKRAGGWELLITTAGADDTSLLGRLYDKGRRIESGEIPDDPSFLFDWLEAPAELDISDPEQRAEAVRFCHPDSDRFTSHERVLRRFDEIPQFEFERYFLNRWTAAATEWLPAGAWEACLDPAATIPDGSPVVLGVDVGTKRDTSAVVRCWKREDDRVVVEAEVFAPRGDGTALDLATVEAAVGANADRFDVRAVVYDRWSFERSAQDLEDRGLTMVEMPMSAERMTVTSQDLFDAVVNQRIAHAGDPVLSAHVAAGGVKPHERGWRLVKGKSRRPIDALIALALAFSQIDQARETEFIWEVF